MLPTHFILAHAETAATADRNRPTAAARIYSEIFASFLAIFFFCSAFPSRMYMTFWLWGEPAPCMDSTRAVPPVMFSMSRRTSSRSRWKRPPPPSGISPRTCRSRGSQVLLEGQGGHDSAGDVMGQPGHLVDVLGHVVLGAVGQQRIRVVAPLLVLWPMAEQAMSPV